MSSYIFINNGDAIYITLVFNTAFGRIIPVPRGDHKAERPYRTWTVLVDKQHRVRVPLGEVTTIVPWIVGAEATIACMGTPSPAGGIQLEPVEPVGDVETQYIELLGGDVPQVSDTAEKWVEVARLFATSWRVQIAIESSRISISLPEPARKAGLLPSAGTQAVVFGFGHILEVCEAARWYEHVRGIAKLKMSLVADAMEDLQGR
jgi:hypothetical protein